MRRLVTRLTVASVALSACAGSPDRASVTVTDSAGVEIVHSAAPAWGAGEGWAVDPEPIVDIGVVAGDPAYQLDRVSDATFLSDGRVVVANAGSAELRVFDADGRHLQTLGGPGEGPGEFRVVAEVWALPGDSILAFDAGLGRLSLFNPQGELARTIPLEHRSGPAPPQLEGRFGTGDLLATRGEGLAWSPGDEGLLEPGEWIFERYAPDGTYVDEIVRYPTSPQWALRMGDRVYLEYVPFVNDRPPRAAAAERLYTGRGSSFRIEGRALDGRLVRIVRRDGEPRPVGDVEVARYRTYRLGLARSDDARRRAERFLDEMEAPETMPASQALLVDELGHLWAEHYRPPWEEQPRWSVFDPRGRWLGEIETPPGVRILRIGSHAILGLRRDELDVQHVVVFGLARGSA